MCALWTHDHQVLSVFGLVVRLVQLAVVTKRAWGVGSYLSPLVSCLLPRRRRPLDAKAQTNVALAVLKLRLAERGSKRSPVLRKVTA